MAAPKFRTDRFSKLYQEQTDKVLHEKEIVEALTKRLNEMILNDPKLAKKASLVLEQWINKKSRP